MNMIRSIDWINQRLAGILPRCPATGIGLIEPLANTVAFYFHERAWRRVDGGDSPRNNAAPMCCGLLKAR